jgi:hypothetical protein
MKRLSNAEQVSPFPQRESGRGRGDALPIRRTRR